MTQRHTLAATGSQALSEMQESAASVVSGHWQFWMDMDAVRVADFVIGECIATGGIDCQLTRTQFIGRQTR